jgi:hypothetical protein
MRQCNRVAEDPENPDTVAFVGWEWTQVGTTPEDHYGHKNVILAHTDEERVPARPIAARSTMERLRRGFPRPSLGLGLLALAGRDRRYHDFVTFAAERSGLQDCEPGVPVRASRDCVKRGVPSFPPARQNWGRRDRDIHTTGLHSPARAGTNAPSAETIRIARR